MTGERPRPESVCAVIPTYNCKEPLAKCLEAVQHQTRPVDEVIVVDNASTDGTAEMIQGRFAGSVTYVRLPENLGGAGGFDRGMRLAYEHGHDWIWCLDSDVLPPGAALENLLSASYPSMAPVVAKTCLFRDPETGRIYPEETIKGRKRGGADLPCQRSCWEGKILPADFATLCCLLVRADAAQQVGFIRTDLFIYFDEHFFSYGLRKRGEIIRVGTVVVEHPEAGGRTASSRYGRKRTLAEANWRTYYFTRNQLLYDRRYRGLCRTLIRSLYVYVRCLATTLILDDHKLYRIRILTKAYWDGFLGRTGKRVDPREFQIRYGSRPVPR